MYIFDFALFQKKESIWNGEKQKTFVSVFHRICTNPTLFSILLSLDPIELVPLSLARSSVGYNSQVNYKTGGLGLWFVSIVSLLYFERAVEWFITWAWLEQSYFPYRLVQSERNNGRLKSEEHILSHFPTLLLSWFIFQHHPPFVYVLLRGGNSYEALLN